MRCPLSRLKEEHSFFFYSVCICNSQSLFDPSSAVIRSECPLAVTDTCERFINKSLPWWRYMAVSLQRHMDSVCMHGNVTYCTGRWEAAAQVGLAGHGCPCCAPCHYNDWGHFLPLKMGPGGTSGSACLIQASSPGMFIAAVGVEGVGQRGQWVCG